MSGARRSSYVLIASVGIVQAVVLAAVMLGDLRTGHFFNEDYAVDLQQAMNILHGKSPSDLGIRYWFDPTRTLMEQSPATYPPLTGLLYVGPVALFGLDLERIKVAQIVLADAGLLAFASLLLRNGFTLVEASLSLLVFVLGPDMTRAVDSIGSDLPFLLVLAAALAAVQDFVAARTTRRVVGWGLVAGIAIMLALLSRTVALALLLTLCVADLLHARRLRWALAIPFGTVVTLWGAQALLSGGSSSYELMMYYPFFVPGAVLRGLVWTWERELEPSTLGALALPSLLLLTGFAVIGVAYHVWRGVPIALFLAFYTALLLVLPNFGAGLRYVMPHLVVAAAYACLGARLVIARLGLQQRLGVVAVLPVLAVSLAVPAAPAGALPFGVPTPESQAMLSAIRQDVPSDALVAAGPSRSFHLFTGRRTIMLPKRGKDTSVQQWLDLNNVQFIALRTVPDLRRLDFSDCPESPLCAGDPERFGFHVVLQEQFWTLLARSPVSTTPPNRTTGIDAARPGKS